VVLRIWVLKKGGERHESKCDKKIGSPFVGIWLIVTGLLHALSAGNPVMSVLLALLAISAGILIVLERQTVCFQRLSKSKSGNFESKKWPHFTDSEWRAKIRDFFEVKN
jgi:hypothetical protein